MRLVVYSVAASLVLASSAMAQKASDEDFFGTWIPADESDRSCFGLSEGAHFTVHRNYYAPGDGGACKEARTWLEKGRLRVSANCDGEEYTFRALTREFQLTSPTRLTTAHPSQKKPAIYFACTMPNVDIRQAHIDNLRKVADATEAVASAILDQGQQTAATDAQLAAKQNAIARAAGFTSFKQFDQIRFIVADIVEFAGESRYLELRHKPSNVSLARANMAALEWLLPAADGDTPK